MSDDEQPDMNALLRRGDGRSAALLKRLLGDDPEPQPQPSDTTAPDPAHDEEDPHGEIA